MHIIIVRLIIYSSKGKISVIFIRISLYDIECYRGFFVCDIYSSSGNPSSLFKQYTLTALKVKICTCYKQQVWLIFVIEWYLVCDIFNSNSFFSVRLNTAQDLLSAPRTYKVHSGPFIVIVPAHRMDVYIRYTLIILELNFGRIWNQT